MKGYWETLRPFERRVVVAVGVFLFLVLNWLFVFPYFSEWSKLDDRTFQANRKLRLYDSVLTQTNVYWREVRQMESEGLDVPAEDQVRHFANTIDAQAGKSGVNLLMGGRTTQTTNQFFIELTRSISAQSPEQPLVEFLYSLGSGNSLIRVRDLTLRPDPQRQQLVANITLAASYQKKSTAKPSPGSGAAGSKTTLAENTGGNQPTPSTKK